MKKVNLKQGIHKVCYGVEVVTFCEALRYLFDGKCNSIFWGLMAIYLVLLVALHVWEDRDPCVRMYPYADDEFYYDDELEEEDEDGSESEEK